MARPEGLEPSTYRLTAGRSTIELRANKSLLPNYYSKSKFICKPIFKVRLHILVINWLLLCFLFLVHNIVGCDDIHLSHWDPPRV